MISMFSIAHAHISEWHVVNYNAGVQRGTTQQT